MKSNLYLFVCDCLTMFYQGTVCPSDFVADKSSFIVYSRPLSHLIEDPSLGEVYAVMYKNSLQCEERSLLPTT